VPREIEDDVNFLRGRAFSIVLLLGVIACETRVVAADSPADGASKASVSRTGCEFGVEGEPPPAAADLDVYLKAIRDLGAEFFVCQFTPERNPKTAGRRASGATYNNGGQCVTLDSLAPADVAGKSGEVSDGSGKWLVVKDFRSPEVRAAVAPFLGKPNEISYRIGRQSLTVNRGRDGNTIRIYLQGNQDAARDREPSESARVW
jgi:hypothetical protein